jgi:hypothetical protein
MGLSDLNILEYFTELHLLLRAGFLIGFLLFLGGMVKSWPVALVGLAIVAVSLAYNFACCVIYREFGTNGNRKVSWTNVTHGTVSLIVGFFLLLAAAHPTIATNLNSNAVPDPQENPSVPEYISGDMKVVNEFVESLKPKPAASYGFKEHNDEVARLYVLVQDFLGHIKGRNIKYADAKPFYTAIDQATGLLVLKGFRAFTEQQDKADYNWNVYGGPSKFRAHLYELKELHEENFPRNELQIEDFQAKEFIQ